MRTFHATFIYVIGEPKPYIFIDHFNHQNKFLFSEPQYADLNPLFLDLTIFFQKCHRKEKIYFLNILYILDFVVYIHCEILSSLNMAALELLTIKYQIVIEEGKVHLVLLSC